MGLLDKIKNILFEVEEIELDEDKISNGDSRKKEDLNTSDEPQPKRQKEEVDEMEDIISERELFQSETTFKFPIIFEEEDFIIEKENNANPNILDYESSKLKEKPIKELKKKFSVSPVISPVYGILDKKYKREVSLKDMEEIKQEGAKQVINFDVVRQKAYGPLAKDIEDVLEDEDNKGMFFNLKSADNEEEIDESNLLFDMSEPEGELTVKELIVDDIEDDFTDFIEEAESEKEDKELKINPNEGLFDLIDSMYDVEGDDL